MEGLREMGALEDGTIWGARSLSRQTSSSSGLPLPLEGSHQHDTPPDPLSKPFLYPTSSGKPGHWLRAYKQDCVRVGGDEEPIFDDEDDMNEETYLRDD